METPHRLTLKILTLTLLLTSTGWNNSNAAPTQAPHRLQSVVEVGQCVRCHWQKTEAEALPGQTRGDLKR